MLTARGLKTDKGCIDAEDREGRPHRYPLLSISIGAASTAVRPFVHRAEAVAVATEMNALAKRTSAPAWSSTAGGASPGRAQRHACHPAPESTTGLHLRG